MKRYVNKERIMPKILFNVGAGLDIPTGAIVTGANGESIINGGLGYLTGFTGPGNSFKSTTMHFMMLSAANHIAYTHDTSMSTYDTEVNITTDRLNDFANKQPYLPKDTIYDENPMWSVTDKALAPADKWVDETKVYLKEKLADKDSMADFTAFRDPYTRKMLRALLPNFVEIDSLSEFESEATMDMQEKNTKDDGSNNTLYMKQGLYKNKFVAELPSLAARNAMYTMVTAHIGEKINMGGMYAPQPTKQLQHLKGDEKIKGVSPKFMYLSSSFWYMYTASLLKNSTTKLAEYPLNSDDTHETDLNLVKMKQLRAKTGSSGYILEIIVSQVEGVLPALTEFHHIKNNGRFGIEGTNTSYNIIFHPDVKISRTTVRRKVQEDPLLARAVNIASELLQLHKFHPQLKERGLLCTPEELYNDLKALGYDWVKHILPTRGWWAVDQYNTDIFFLSIVDLLMIRKGLYHPYFLDKDLNVKKEYQKFLKKD